MKLSRAAISGLQALPLLWILIAISYSSIFVSTVQATTTTYYPSSSNIPTGSHVSGDMNSLVTVDTDYYIVRSASSATATAPYNPSGYNLLGYTSHASGTISDLASDNSAYMIFHSYASQTSATSLSRATIGYRSNTGTSTLSSPKMRSWSGSAWDGTETELSTAGSPVRWVRTACCPLMARCYEKIIVTLSDDGYLDAYVWTGSSWSVTIQIGNVGTIANAYRPFDIAYEKTSGKAMLVYGISSTDTSKDLAYKTWDGSSWSAEGYINDSGQSTDIQYYWVDLASKPTSGANEIALVALEGTTIEGSVRGWIWAGNNWGNELGLETDTIKNSEDIGVAYESLSGNAMFVWGDDLVGAYDSRRWLGSSWEAKRLVTSSISGAPGWLTLRSDPASNRIMFLTIDSVKDLWTADWNPTTWTAHSPNHDTIYAATTRDADGDWEPTGGKYLMLYDKDNNLLKMKTWTAASGWSTPTSVSAVGRHPWVQLRRNPRDVAGDVKILGAMLNSNNDVGALKWDGTTLTNLGDSLFTADTTVTTYECFDLRFQVLGDPTEFMSEVEFTGSSNTYSWTQLVWTVDNAWTAASVTVTIQLYNYNTASYPTSGDGYYSYTSSATPNTDEANTQTITANPQNFRDVSGNWKVKIKGVKATSTRFDFKVDWVEYKTTYPSEYTASTEYNFSGMTGYTPTQLVLTVVSQYDIASVTVTIQVYNYNTGQYATSGEGYLTYTSSATPSTDETKTLTITTNPSYYVSSGNAKIKVTGVKTTTTQLQQKTNQIKLDYDYSPTKKIVFTTAAQMITAGEASAVMTIQTQDASSNPVNVPSDMTITLSSTSGTGKFSLSDSAWSEITSITITASSSVASFYYKDTTAGTPTITAAESPSQDWADAAQQQTVNPTALAHFTFNTISSPQTAGTAFSITITAKDQYENNVTSYTGTNTLSDTTGTISPTSTGAFISGFWTGIVTINKAQTGVAITTTGSGKSGTSNPFDVNPQSINKVVITVYPSSVTAGSWTSKYTVQKRDPSGNPTTIGSVTVNLASTSSGANKKFSLTPGGSSVNSVTMPDGSSTRDFYYYDELSGTWTISVAAGATGDSKPLAVNPASLDHFTFSNIPNPQTANIPFTITITARDVYENIVTSYAGTNTLSDLTGTIKPTSTGTFASGAWTGSVIITKAQKGVIITTTGGGKSGTSNTLNIIDASSDFALYVSPTRLSLAQNDSGIVTVTVEVMSIAGFQDDVALTLENVPAGFNCSFEHPSVAPLPYGYVETKLILQRYGLPSPGSYTLTVIGSSGAKTHTASFLLVVSPPSYGKCVIATATYGSELTPQVQFLKDFKDHYVLSTFAGSEFMKVFNSWYYSFSPQVASWIASNPSAKEAAKILLLPLLNILRLSEISYSTLSFAPEVAVVVAGIVASFLIGIVYFGPILAVVCMRLAYRRAQLVFIWATLIWGFSLLLLTIGLVSAPYLVMSASSILVLSTMILGSWSIPLATSKIFNPDWKMKIHILGGTPNDLLTTELEGNPLEYESPLDSTIWSTYRCSLFGQQCHLRISGRLVGWSGAGITPLGV